MKAVLAAQESSKVCPKCFEVNDHGAVFCIECGAPFSEDPADEGSDQEVYREITQANLHRIRGDYKDAVDTCLSILKRFPNNGTAHTLLGDIHAEQGELEQAAQWFEMALDLRPESENDRRKLDTVNKRISQQEAATTAKQLGIPESKPRTQQYTFVMAILIAIVGIAGFLAGSAIKGKEAKSDPQVINEPINVSPQQPEPQQREVTETAPTWLGNTDETQILSSLKSNEVFGDRILSVQLDPRISKLAVTALAKGEDNAVEVTATIAQSVFTSYPNMASVSVRLTDGQVMVFMGDVLVEDYTHAIEQGGEANDIVSNIWPLNLDN